MTPQVWGTDPANNIYTRKNGNWKKVTGKLMHVTTGASGTWGVSSNYMIWYYSGRWTKVSGRLKQIDSGPRGIVCGVNKGDGIYCRTGITAARPSGKGWIRLPGALKYISCGALGHWGVNKKNNIYFRYGVNSGRPQGTKWKHIPGKLHQVESGPDGAVWGVNFYTGVFTRLGINSRRPTGTRWKRFAKKKLVSVSVGLGFLYGVGPKGKPYSAPARALVGKKGLPRRPSGMHDLNIFRNKLMNDPYLPHRVYIAHLPSFSKSFNRVPHFLKKTKLSAIFVIRCFLKSLCSIN